MGSTNSSGKNMPYVEYNENKRRKLDEYCNDSSDASSTDEWSDSITNVEIKQEVREFPATLDTISITGEEEGPRIATSTNPDNELESAELPETYPEFASSSVKEEDSNNAIAINGRSDDPIETEGIQAQEELYNSEEEAIPSTDESDGVDKIKNENVIETEELESDDEDNISTDVGTDDESDVEDSFEGDNEDDIETDVGDLADSDVDDNFDINVNIPPVVLDTNDIPVENEPDPNATISDENEVQVEMVDSQLPTEPNVYNNNNVYLAFEDNGNNNNQWVVAIAPIEDPSSNGGEAGSSMSPTNCNCNGTETDGEFNAESTPKEPKLIYVLFRNRTSDNNPAGTSSNEPEKLVMIPCRLYELNHTEYYGLSCSTVEQKCHCW